MIIGITLILFACAGSPVVETVSPKAEARYIITLPEPGNLIILGVAGRQSTRENELNIAKEDASRKASFYHMVSGTLVGWQYLGPGFWDYDVGSASWLEYDEELESYKNKLSYDPDKDITRDRDGVTYIRFSYPADFPGRISYWIGKNPDGSPEWITRPPEMINGFIAGVGHSGRQERFSDTVRRSYEAAVIAIVSNVSTFIETSDTSFYSQTELNFRLQSSATLKNYLVLETWVEPETGAVYTLAIAEAAN